MNLQEMFKAVGVKKKNDEKGLEEEYRTNPKVFFLLFLSFYLCFGKETKLSGKNKMCIKLV